MFLTQLTFALVIAAFLSAVFAVGFRRSGPWASAFIFFVVVFLASLAGGLWISPIGPRLWGAHWLPFLLVGLIIALLLAAAPLTDRSSSSVELVDRTRERREEKQVRTALDVFFWVLIISFVLVILAHYLR